MHDLPIIGYTAFPTEPMSPELIRKPLYYDRSLRRLWIKGQRCHHGATGALLASMGAMALAADPEPAEAAVVVEGLADELG